MNKLKELKNSEDSDNRLEYAKATGDWQHLKYDEDLENREEAEHYLNLINEKHRIIEYY
jgi:hypothetical protein